ncbi:MAG: hypothetical protein LAO07_06810 [Acidobacteriia bacterium]|nr:hypothetical protein [Terriglobia bacterium]
MNPLKSQHTKGSSTAPRYSVGRSHRIEWDISGKISNSKAHAVLEELANLPEPSAAGSAARLRLEKAVGSIKTRFPEVFVELRNVANLEPSPAQQHDMFLLVIIGLSRHVRQAWRAKPQGARWIIFELRRLYQECYWRAVAHRLRAKVPKPPQQQLPFLDALQDASHRAFYQWGWHVNPPPQATTFDLLMLRFEHMLNQARYCENNECQSPYFFAYNRRKRKRWICSAACFRVWRRKYRQDWWKNKGSKRRQKKPRIWEAQKEKIAS